MPPLEPPLRALVGLRVLAEGPPELRAHGCEGLVAEHVVELDALVEFAVAHGAEVDGVRVGLFQVVRALHQAFVVSAVTQTEHVADFVRCDFAGPHEKPLLLLFRRAVFLLGERGSESVQALDSSEGWDSVAEAEVREIGGVEVDVGERDEADGVSLRVLDRPNDLLEEVDGVVLGWLS